MQLRFYNMPLTSYRAVNALSAVVCAWLFILPFSTYKSIYLYSPATFALPRDSL